MPIGSPLARNRHGAVYHPECLVADRRQPLPAAARPTSIASAAPALIDLVSPRRPAQADIGDQVVAELQRMRGTATAATTPPRTRADIDRDADERASAGPGHIVHTI
jgi:hypothetical protein